MIDLKEISAHSKSVEEVTELLGTNLTVGISENDAKQRLEIYGRNELIKGKSKTAWQIFVAQFKDFLVYLLFFAIVVSLIIGIWEASRPGAEL